MSASPPASTHETPGVDLSALTTFLDSALEAPRAGGLRAQLLSGGRSNLTYVVTDGHTEWVLRRPPLGHVLETAHDMGREYRVMEALRDTPVPVPAMVGFCSDTGPLGAQFYVMEKVDGVTYRDDADFRKLTPEGRGALGRAFLDSLAALAAVDYQAVGLGDFGRPEGYSARQVGRWRKQLAASASRDVPGIERLAERLEERVPHAQRASIVHGDFRLDNALIAPEDPSQVRAVIDWEMATLGDPLTDLGLFYLFWEGWRGLDNPIAATPVEYDGFASWSELSDRYARATGLDLSEFGWYAAFAFYKLAVICEGIHFRHAQGLTVGDGFEGIGDLVAPLVTRGLDTLTR